ncbi:hypothetical protein HDIA_4079 [Hartmannibacter diazotrophicus]|uniref:Aminoglycoside-2''-adenylyltransferase n=1 Tax=Hartmannibacter diazotrophicus TaxID=1482074 RepID=A0A2C9DBS5_9HYPH|nr:hypothetical protein [Hartmannibacter diazotrophicus]SON57620.1 hypothetical protein HDIA_4079 [Hartmannibacter diazotrophicus]
MANTLETLCEILTQLGAGRVPCAITGGWAEELLGLREPWKHADIDLVYQGETFAALDTAIEHLKPTVREVWQKRFRHKRAFVFEGTLCEITLVQGGPLAPVTHYWGDVPFHWQVPLLHQEMVDLPCCRASVMSADNLLRHRLCWKETQPHRWRDPASLEPARRP